MLGITFVGEGFHDDPVCVEGKDVKTLRTWAAMQGAREAMYSR